MDDTMISVSRHQFFVGLAVVAALVLLGVGGYLVGHSTGEDLDAATAQGTAQGQREGAAKGAVRILPGPRGKILNRRYVHRAGLSQIPTPVLMKVLI